MRYKILILFFVIMLFSNLIMATVQLGNLSHQIDFTYTSSEPIRGWVNFSLDDEPGDTLVSGFGSNITIQKCSNITIQKFLESNDIICNIVGPYECSCTPNDCQESYSTTGSRVAERKYSMNLISTQLFGIKLTENISQITNFRFNITTDAKDSCLNPVMLDLFDDRNIDFRVSEISDDECLTENPFGCYKSVDVKGSTKIGLDHLCGKIEVPPLRGFRIGANIIGNGTAILIMTFE